MSNGPDYLKMVEVFVQVIGFGGVVWGLVEHRRTLQTQTAIEFYRRFAELSSRMPPELRIAAYAAGLNNLPEPKRTAIILAAIDYFNLCSEEYALQKAGRLPSFAWEVTEAEFARKITSPLWRDAWIAVRNEYASQREFIAYIDRLSSRPLARGQHIRPVFSEAH